MKRTAKPDRKAFTLVELLVAMSLIALILSILATAFTSGLEVFREGKAIGDLSERLRTVTIQLRTDLISRHFGDESKVSTLDKIPEKGFFRIEALPPILEGRDDSGMPSWRADTHALHFTVRRIGKNRESFFTANLPPNAPMTLSENQEALNFGESRAYLAREAEVSYFLAPMLDAGGNWVLADGTSAPQDRQLFALYRRVKVFLPEPITLAPGWLSSDFRDLSSSTWTVPGSPPVVTLRSMREGAASPSLRGLAIGGGEIDRRIVFGNDELLASDVLSFVVEVMPGDGFTFVPLSSRTDPSLYGAQVRPVVIGEEEAVGTVAPSIYDTAFWNRGGPTVRERLKAIRVTVRLWDYRTGMSRQVSIIQDL